MRRVCSGNRLQSTGGERLPNLGSTLISGKFYEPLDRWGSQQMMGYGRQEERQVVDARTTG